MSAGRKSEHRSSSLTQYSCASSENSCRLLYFMSMQMIGNLINGRNHVQEHLLSVVFIGKLEISDNLIPSLLTD